MFFKEFLVNICLCQNGVKSKSNLTNFFPPFPSSSYIVQYPTGTTIIDYIRTY